VNIVFYRRDGSSDHLLMEKPAWINAVLIPDNPADRYFYEISISDTNGDERLDIKDNMTLWSSEPDGTGLSPVWMPAGEVESTRYREPLSGDFFGTIVKDTDLDGSITQYDRPNLFRLSIGDTVATSVVTEAMVKRIHNIVFGEFPEQSD
jgi:hypothetical protein